MRARCTVDGCRKSVVARGYCTKHYQRWQKHGDPNTLIEYWPERRRFQLDDMLNRGWSDERIGRSLGCSPSTVKKARLRFGMKARYLQHHTARDVCRLLGVHHMATQRWIEEGRLEAARTDARYGRFQVWQISESALMAFLENPDNWHCWTPETISDRFLRDWAVELRGDVRFCSIKEAAVRLGVHYMTVWHRIKRGQIVAARDGGIVWIDERSLAASDVFGAESEAAE